MMKTNKTHNAILLPALLLIWAMVFSASSVAANPCTTSDGYLDIGIGAANDSPPRKGIGGTGRSGDDDDKGIGGTGRSGDDDDKGIGGTGAVGHNNGIGGTGQTASREDSELIYVTGTIHAFGSVCVNGVEIEYEADTPVSTDNNQTLAASSLKVGQVVEIIAEKRNGMPKARKIAVRFPLKGTVTEINPDGRMINVMGKPVRLAGPQAGKSFQLGDNVRVSGLQNTAGQIVATFIERTPRQTHAGAPSKARVIPSGISNFSVQGYVQRRTAEGRVTIQDQSFDLGVSGKDIEVGTRMIVSGKRQKNGAIRASSWVRERTVLGTRLRSGEKGGSGHQNRNRGRGRGGDDDKEDNSGSGRGSRPDDDDRIDKSGSGRDKSDRIDNSGRGRGRGRGRGGRSERIERPDKSGRGRGGRPDRVERPDRSGKKDRPERMERPDTSGRGRGGRD
jgi:Domain of unknown function (DUF5666)